MADKILKCFKYRFRNDYKMSTRTFSSPFSSKHTSMAARIVFSLRSRDSICGSEITGAN